MQVIFMFLCLVAICVAVFYYFKYEEELEIIDELNEELDKCKKTFEEIEEDIVKKQDLNSAHDVKNKLRTILESVKKHQHRSNS